MFRKKMTMIKKRYLIENSMIKKRHLIKNSMRQKLVIFETLLCYYKVLNIFKYFTETSIAEAVVQRCSGKKVFLQISQNSQENTSGTGIFL